MDTHAAAVLEFESIRAALARHTESDLARPLVDALAPSTDAGRITLSLKQVDEARHALDAGEAMPVRGLKDALSVVARCRERSRPLEAWEAWDIACFLRAATALKTWLAARSAKFAVLASIATKMEGHDALRALLDRSVDSPGVIPDAASAELRRCRGDVVRHEHRARTVMDGLVDSPKYRSWLQEKTWSVRNGRYVLPVRLEMKGHVPGILHDKSASGSTVFVEPREVVAIANEVSEARLDAVREETRILWELTRAVFDAESALKRTADIAAWIAFTAARASFSREIDGMSPRVSDDGRLLLRRARHPLLVLRNAASGAPAPEPLTIELSASRRMIVVTGPNTGGKTVVLKTLGLLQIMFQCGLHVPAAAGTELPVLTDVLADIGDEQSLQQSLSTFSGHVRQIAGILGRCGPSTLVLMDELGAGTDPAEGAALGEAVLERIRASGALAAVTTHLGSLKTYAFSRPDVENASMEFDDATLAPTYRLITGTPGRSMALLVASRHGMPKDVVAAAETVLAAGRDGTNDLIDALRSSREAAENDRRRSEDLLESSRRAETEARRRLDEASKERGRLESEAEAETRRALDELEKAATPHLNALRNAPKAFAADVEALRRLVADRGALPSLAERRRAFLDGLKKDDEVWVPRLGQLARVKRVHRAEGRLTVVIGAMTMDLPADDVSFVTPPKVK